MEGPWEIGRQLEEPEKQEGLEGKEQTISGSPRERGGYYGESENEIVQKELETIKCQGTSSEMKDRDFVSEHVVNLSDRVLSMAEIKVLSKDLNFCLTPGEINRFELNKDLQEFAG